MIHRGNLCICEHWKVLYDLSEEFYIIEIILKYTLKMYFIFFKILFIYLTERDTAREGTQAGRVGEGEAGSPMQGLIPGP